MKQSYEQYKRMRANACRGCDRGLTWAEQRRRFGRAMRAGLTVEEVKALTPRCQKCMTLVLPTRRRASAKSV